MITLLSSATLLCSPLISPIKKWIPDQRGKHQTHLCDEIELLASNGLVTPLRGKRDKVETEVACPKIGNVEAEFRVSCTPDLSAGGSASSSRVKGGARSFSRNGEDEFFRSSTSGCWLRCRRSGGCWWCRCFHDWRCFWLGRLLRGLLRGRSRGRSRRISTFSDDPSLLRCQVWRCTRGVTQEAVGVQGQTCVASTNTSILRVSDSRKPNTLRQVGSLVKKELLVERRLSLACSTTSACKETWSGSVVLVSSAVNTTA
jgi:hypothetical protein